MMAASEPRSDGATALAVVDATRFQRTTSLISPSAHPCGVESFARRVALQLAADGGAGERHDTFALTGQPGEAAILQRTVGGQQALIVHLPVVAWKRHVLAPLQAMRAARAAGLAVVLVLHEWADLDWKRRATYLGYLPFADRIVFSAPIVAGQFAADPVTRFATASRGLVPIPVIIRPPATIPTTAFSQTIDALRGQGKLVIGHFGSIYPKKQSTDVLEIVAALKAGGRPAHAVFVGDVIESGQPGAARRAFDATVAALGLGDDVSISGYLRIDDDVIAAIAATDVCVYRFNEGLSSRRSSVLTCLQAGRPVVVNANSSANEFQHHVLFQSLLGSGQLVALAPDADIAAFADAVARAAVDRTRFGRFDPRPGWQAAARAIAARS